ncbi:major royal jelly family protein [Fulvivirga maritima]|uniref:major royal jelly family protein n=1 Tax=Fulvivirga maritima TaxID=2904247 RepID=UPI001F42BED2|nr:major royal jelly family protein [Fulvivirga maritima]UII25960.1 major royal jelly family protein [Fulvivirga maritima]
MKRYFLIALLYVITISSNQAQQYHSDKLMPVASFGKSMAIGLSVSSDNRVFVAFPNYNGDGKYTLTEEKNGELSPYPNVEWNTNGDYKSHLLRVQDLYVDANDYLWVLDSKPASKGSIFGDDGKSEEGKFKLVKINTKNDQVEKTYLFEDLDKTVSGLNDIRVDTEKELAYLSDPGQAAIVVLDLKTGKSRSVLVKTKFTLADDDLILDYGGNKMVDKNGKPFSSHVNGIALTKDFKYLYFKPINQLNLYRIETKYLAKADLSDKQLKKHVEDMGEVGITHGLVADAKGNIFLTTSINYTITYLSPDGQLHTLVQDSRLIWPDSLGTGSDGYLYFTCAQLQRLPQWNNGGDKTEYPYTMYKVKLP